MNVINSIKLKKEKYSFKCIKKIADSLSPSKKTMFFFELIDYEIPIQYITDELFEYAALSGYYITNKSPERIRKKIKYIEFCVTKTISGYKSIDYIDEKFLTDKLILSAFKNQYVMSDSSPKKILTNKYLIKECLKNSFCVENIIIFLKYYPNEDLVEEDIKFIIDNCNALGIGNSFLKYKYKIIKNKNVLGCFIKYLKNVVDFDYLFECCSNDIIDDEILISAAERGYCPSNSSPKIITSNKNLLVYLLEKKNLDCAIYSYFKNVELTEDLISLFINKDYLITTESPKRLKNSYNFVKSIVEHATEVRIIEYAVSYCNQDILDDYIISLAIKKGYGTGKRYCDKILNNYDYIIAIINNTCNCDIINHINEELIDKKIVSLALKYNYKLSKNSPLKLKRAYGFVLRLILKEDENTLDRALYYCDPSILDDNLITKAIDKGLVLSPDTKSINDIIGDNPKYIRLMIDNLLEWKVDRFNKFMNLFKVINIKNLTKAQIIKIINTYPVLIVNYFALEENASYINNIFRGEFHFSNNKYKNTLYTTFDIPISYLILHHSIMNKDVIFKLGLRNVLRIIKYGLLGAERFDLAPIIDKNKIDNLILLYTTLTDRGIYTVDILKFIKYTNFYYDYYDLINEIIDKDLLDKYKYKLIDLCSSKYKVGVISTLEELDNLEVVIYNYNEDISNNEDIVDIKNSIFLILIKNDYEEVKTLLNSVINSKKINILIENNSLINYKTILEKYKILIELLEEIYLMEDIEQLKIILKTLNTDLMVNRNRYINLNNNFKDIIKAFKYIYGAATKARLTVVSDRTSTDRFKIDKRKYKTRKKSINGMDVVNSYATYIEISEEAYFLQHVMNAYGTGGKIQDFKKGRTVGKTYICLSATSNVKSAFLPRYITSINNVILLFNDIPANLLVFVNSTDLGSNARLNDLDLKTKGDVDFDIIENIILNSDYYSEYVFYREDLNGNSIYPCGILVNGEKPNKYEINAAIYLNVPLIKLLPVRTNIESRIVYDNNIGINDSAIEQIEEVKRLIKRR